MWESKRILVALATLPIAISGCAFLREQFVPASYIQSKVDPAFVRASFFAGRNCPGVDLTDEMVLVGNICIDRYEASIWTHSKAGSQLTGPNYPCNKNGANCSGKIFARSVRGVLPALDVTWFQASAACAASGKRLLTNAEWQTAAFDTPDDPKKCNVATSSRLTGSGLCISSFGVEDMIGNASEWVTDWSQANTRNDGGEISLPEFGSDKIAGIDEAAPESFRLPSALIRGGSFLDGKDAGVYALDAQNAPVRSRPRIGFRCAK